MELLNKRLSLIDKSVDNIDVTKIQKDVFAALKRFLYKEIEVDKDGKIIRNLKNFKALQKVRLLRNIVVNDDYKQKVSEFLGTFDEVKMLSDKYIKQL